MVRERKKSRKTGTTKRARRMEGGKRHQTSRQGGRKEGKGEEEGKEEGKERKQRGPKKRDSIREQREAEQKGPEKQEEEEIESDEEEQKQIRRPETNTHHQKSAHTQHHSHTIKVYLRVLPKQPFFRWIQSKNWGHMQVA